MSPRTELDLLAQETAGMEKGEHSLELKTRGALHTQMPRPNLIHAENCGWPPIFP